MRASSSAFPSSCNPIGNFFPLTELANPQGTLIPQIPAKAAGTVHVWINNLPYAQRLEDGWSKQAPSGMVGLAVREFRSIVESAAGEANP